MAGLRLSPTPIAGLFEAASLPVADHRGSFARLFCAADLAAATNGRAIVQINRSVTHRAGTVRGLHYQVPPHAEGKWIRCLRGRVYDVGVDLRPDSPTFLDHHAVELDAEAGNAVYLPEGIAHGVQTLTDGAELLYLHTAPHAPDCERGVTHDDPRLAIRWPLPVTAISERDRALPRLDPAFEGVPC